MSARFFAKSFILCLLLAISAAAQAPNYGGVNAADRRYISGYFGFSYRFPEGWSGRASYGPAQNASASTTARFVSLFTASPAAATANEIRYIGIQADDLAPMRDVHSAKDFLDLSLKSLAGSSGEFDSLRQTRAMYGGRQFFRQDLRSKYAPGAPPFFQTQLVTVLRNHAITFSFIASNADDLEELVRTAESLNFFEPGSVTVPEPSAAPEVAAKLLVAAPPQPVGSATVSEQAEVTTVIVSAQSKSEPSQTAATKFSATKPAPEISEQQPNEVMIVHAQAPVSAAPLAKNASGGGPLQNSAPNAVTATPHATYTTAISSAKLVPENPAPAAMYAPAPKPTASALMQPLYTSGASQPLVSTTVAEVSQPAAVARPALTPAPVPVPPQTGMPKFAAAPNLPPTVASAPAAVTSVASPALPSRIRVSALSFENYIASKNAVSYPEMAKMQHVEGAVLLDVIVGSDGSLKEVKALSGPTLLRAGAVDAVKRWRFKPYVIDGAPVEVESTISLNFRLNQ